MKVLNFQEVSLALEVITYCQCVKPRLITENEADGEMPREQDRKSLLGLEKNLQ